ncbi:WAT1-related protein At4g16620-like isoform X2 [Phalaenopsis equestris]|uniref:WAT1-related protein At4g16620-like isoform X2 n=1 Tax=Phalaenopsis equestris TaxID=78828 RepID=UPI0009E6097E|nr:WAT1-related protein At4g16620-like isoform X2 [Phalaenopsis equestris]
MAISSKVNNGRWMEATVVANLIGVQMTYAFYTVFISRLLAGGLQPLFLVAAAGFFNAFLLLPLAIFFERKIWPQKMGLHLAMRLALIAVGGTPLYQVFMLLGVKKTTPAVATAMPNLAPGLIFIIASCLRIEKFDIKCKYTRYKVMGTVICLSGAMAMSFLQGNSVKPAASANLRSIFLREDLAINTSPNEWIIGCLYMLAAVVIISCVLVLQATTMEEFPAPISMTVIAAILGSFFSLIFQYILQGNITSGVASLSLNVLITAVLAGGSVTSISSLVVTMSVHKKGPVFVSVFQPTQSFCAAILSALILKQFISLGSLIGMGLMFVGLYVVLWAKIKEADKEESRLIPDEERALLF